MVRKISDAQVIKAVRDLHKMAAIKQAISAKTKALMALLGITGATGALSAGAVEGVDAPTMEGVGDYWGDKFGVGGDEPEPGPYVPEGAAEADALQVNDEIPYEEPIPMGKNQEVDDADAELDELLKGSEENAGREAALDQATDTENAKNEAAFDERQAADPGFDAAGSLQDSLKDLLTGYGDTADTVGNYWSDAASSDKGQDVLGAIPGKEQVGDYWGHKLDALLKGGDEEDIDIDWSSLPEDVQQKHQAMQDDQYQRQLDSIDTDNISYEEPNAEATAPDISELMKKLQYNRNF